MKPRTYLEFGCLAIASAQVLLGQGALTVPKTVEAGTAFSIQTAGSGKATLYIVGPEQVLRRDVMLGEAVTFDAGSIYNAGHYVVSLGVGSGDGSAENQSFDVLPAAQPANVSFLARPSRLPVGLHGAITGAVFVFDAYQNLMLAPMEVSFNLSSPSGAVQKKSEKTRYGAAWTAMDSSPKQGSDRFEARVGEISSSRIIGQVPGDPCSLKMSARPAGNQLEIETDPVRDCSGNAVPDGTVVTFTEIYGADQSTVDVPLKRGIAKVDMPARPGATITVASGVTMGNQIHWGK